MAQFHRSRGAGEPFDSPLRLLFVGRIERRKGVHTAIAALRDLVHMKIDATMTLVGWKDDSYATELDALAQELGVHSMVRWLNPVSREDLSQSAQFRGNIRNVDVQMTRLRRKIEPDPRYPRYLQTVRGTGYALKPE